MGSSRVRSTPPDSRGLKCRSVLARPGPGSKAALYAAPHAGLYAYLFICMHTVCQLLRSCDPLAPEFESVNGCKKLD